MFFQKILNPKKLDPVQMKKLVNDSKDKSTAVILASRAGNLPVVDYLITHCHGDFTKCGSVTFDGELIEGEWLNF